MSATDLGLLRPTSSIAAFRRAGVVRWLLAYMTLGLLGVPLALLTMRSTPQPTAIAFAILLFGAVCIVARPVIGLYLSVFLTLIGDTQLAWWYPFIKNLSSQESVLYVHDAFIFSPLELYLGLTLVVWLLSRLDVTRPPVERGALLWPVVAFGGLAIVGFVYGVATGGNLNIALWEVRPITYVPVIYVLATNLCRSRRQYGLLLTAAVAGISFEAVHALYVILTATGPEAERIAGLGYLEHSASLHANTIMVWLAAMAVIGERAFRRKLVLSLLLVPVATVYLFAERRSAVIALIAAFVLLAVVLYRRNRAAFWGIVPFTSVVLVLYVAAFWNVQGPLALPAQSIKSAIAPAQLSAADMSSNFYRQIETYNLVETIRQNPVLGRGFGQKFLQVYPLPYIPFVWAEYIPHNSVLWIWMNTGAGGFIAMLYLFGAGVSAGARATTQMRSKHGAALALTATLYIVMYPIYAYVDIAWDTASMVYLGVMLAIVGNISRFDEESVDDPDPGDRVPVPEADSNAPFGKITVVFTPERRERWAS